MLIPPKVPPTTGMLKVYDGFLDVMPKISGAQRFSENNNPLVTRSQLARRLRAAVSTGHRSRPHRIG